MENKREKGKGHHFTILNVVSISENLPPYLKLIPFYFSKKQTQKEFKISGAAYLFLLFHLSYKHFLRSQTENRKAITKTGSNATFPFVCSSETSRIRNKKIRWIIHHTVWINKTEIERATSGNWFKLWDFREGEWIYDQILEWEREKAVWVSEGWKREKLKG